MTETVTTAATVTLGLHNTEREIGITYRQCDHWSRLGLLKPLHVGGVGHRRANGRAPSSTWPGSWAASSLPG